MDRKEPEKREKKPERHTIWWMKFVFFYRTRVEDAVEHCNRR